jgi:hypothetical protein
MKTPFAEEVHSGVHELNPILYEVNQGFCELTLQRGEYPAIFRPS